MTDKEIIQALRLCSCETSTRNCPTCPLYGNDDCVTDALREAADLIERLTAENADLRKEIEWKDMVVALAQKEQAGAEAERDALREKQRWIPVTERMPEEIKAPFTEDTMINLEAQALGVEPSRLREIAEADKDGRCVVLQCKVGDTVWRIVRDGEPHITRDEVRDMYFADDMTLCVELVGGRVTFTEKFGKTVFLSREEAEKALREMEGKKDG